MSNRTDIKNNHISQTTMTDPNVNYPSVKELAKLFRKFANDPYIRLIKDRERTQSIMEILGVNREENKHSDFLAWLFDSSKDHQLGALPADKLIKLLASITPDRDYLLPFLINANEIIASKTKREVSLEHNGIRGRLDILIEMETKEMVSNDKKNIRVVFENKVAASETENEGNGQTLLYHDYYTSGVGDDGTKTIYVYNRCDTNKEPQCKAFICITYQDIVDFIIEPLLQLPHLNERTKFILEDYILALEKPAEIKKNPDKIIMAMGNESKKLLKAFWENNIELIKAAASAVVDSSNSDSAESYNALAESVKEFTNSSNSSYIVRLNFDAPSEIPSIRAAAVVVITKLVEVFKQQDHGLTPERFCQKIETEHYPRPLFLEENDYQTAPKRCKYRYSNETIKFDNHLYHINKEWTFDLFSKFIKDLEEKKYLESEKVTIKDLSNHDQPIYQIR